MDKQTQTPKTQTPAARGYQNVMTDPATLAGLDALIGAALAAGYRPGGRRPSRAAIIGDLVARACDALRNPQGGPQQAPSGPQNAAPACAASAQQDAAQSASDALAAAMPPVPPLPEFAAPRTQPARTCAPHYFALHGAAAGAGG